MSVIDLFDPDESFAFNLERVTKFIFAGRVVGVGCDILDRLTSNPELFRAIADLITNQRNSWVKGSLLIERIPHAKIDELIRMGEYKKVDSQITPGTINSSKKWKSKQSVITLVNFQKPIKEAEVGRVFDLLVL